MEKFKISISKGVDFEQCGVHFTHEGKGVCVGHTEDANVANWFEKAVAGATVEFVPEEPKEAEKTPSDVPPADSAEERPGEDVPPENENNRKNNRKNRN